MDDSERPPTLAEILGFDDDETPAAEAYRVYRDLKFDSGEDFKNLAPRDQHLWYVLKYIWVVNNGGIQEFLSRSAGDFAQETLNSLEAIGARSEFLALSQFFDLFPEKSPSCDQAEREKQIDDICASLPVPLGRERAFLRDAVTHPDANHINDDVDMIYELLMDYWHRQGDRSK